MTTQLISPDPLLYFTDPSGAPLAGGKLFTYQAGTTTKQTTYTDSTGATPNTNPIILDSRGQCRCWITPGLSYKFVLAPATDTDPPTNPLWTVDNITINVISNNVQITGGTIDGTVIGGLVPAAGNFTTINNVIVTTPATTATLTLGGGITLSCLFNFTLTGGDVIVTGSGNLNTFTFPPSTDTLVGVNASQTLLATSLQSDTTTGQQIGTAANQKWGFFGATPVAQQSTTGITTGFTTGAGTTVHDDSTFTGGLGTKAYRLSDVVFALKTLGLIASS